MLVKKGFISSLAFSSDSRVVATGSIQELVARLWDVKTGQLIATLPHEKPCDYCGTGVDVAWSPDGKTIATSSFWNAYLWDAATRLRKAVLIDQTYQQRSGRSISHGQTIYNLAFSRDGQTLATGSRDGTAKLWGAATGQLKSVLKVGWKVNRISFSPDSKIFATGSSVVMLWSVSSGQLLATLPHKGTVWSIAFSPDSKLVATFADNERAVKIWDVVTGQLLQTLTEARDVAAFSPDGRTLATGGRNGAVLLWDVQR